VVAVLQEEKFDGDRKVKKQYRDPDEVRALTNEMMVSFSCINFLHLSFLVIRFFVELTPLIPC